MNVIVIFYLQSTKIASIPLGQVRSFFILCFSLFMFAVAKIPLHFKKIYNFLTFIIKADNKFLLTGDFQRLRRIGKLLIT